jgi:membrane associated rhomboid family serine protease
MSDEPPIEEFDLNMPDDLEVRHCYRHPDRETGVSCSRCGRPICYECMTPAAVGFWCPDCVAEQRRSQGRARVVTRDQTRARWQSSGGVLGASRSPVTRALIAINAAVFIIEVLAGQGQITAIPINTLVRLGGLFTPYIVLEHQYWRLVAAMFLHEGILHIGVNMLSLYFIGTFFEQLAGRSKYIALYLVSGLAGNVAVLVWSPMNALTVGASTAIFGIFAALLVHVFRNRHAYPGQLLGQLVFWMGLNLVLTFTSAGISWQGHVGGLVGGIVTLELLTRFGRRPLRSGFNAGDAVAVAGVVLVLVALVAWRAATFVA